MPAAVGTCGYALRYDSALVRRGVRRFVGWRLVGWDWRLIGAQAVMLACALVLGTHGERSWAGLSIAIGAMPILLGLAGWAAHLTAKLRALRAIGPPVVTVTVEEDALRFRSGAGEAVLALSDVIAWREWPDLWLLVTARNRFIILPMADLPMSLLEHLRARLEEIARDR